MLRFVPLWFEAPHVAAPVEIARTKHTHFTGTAAAQALDADDVRHHIRQVRQSCVDHRVVDRFYRIRIMEAALAALKSGAGGEIL